MAYEHIADFRLRDGQDMEIGVVRSPDADWRPRLVPFLAHKGDEWRPQIDKALAGPLDDLATSFYVGHAAGQLICQTMVAGAREVGILGHVFTRPQDRRKGAIRALLAAALDDCHLNYRCLTLSTGYDSPAYRIYHALGFHGAGPGLGEMIWPSLDVRNLFAPAPAVVRPVRWDDWGFFNLLAMRPPADGDLPRSTLLGVKDQGNVEGAFLRFDAFRGHREQGRAMALVSERGATTGWALVHPDERWFGDTWLLDVYAHPNFATELPRLIAAVSLPDARVVSYATAAGGNRAEALTAAGFRQAATLPGFIDHNGRKDVLVMVR